MTEVKVKPLQWSDTHKHHGTHYAESIVGVWAVWAIGSAGYYRAPDMQAGTPSGSDINAAKAAAQADYEQRIRSALLTALSGMAEPVAWRPEHVIKLVQAVRTCLLEGLPDDPEDNDLVRALEPFEPSVPHVDTVEADVAASMAEHQLTPEQHRHAQFLGGIGDEVWD